MVKYTLREFWNAIFDLAALYGPSDTSQQESRNHKKVGRITKILKIQFKQLWR